MFPYSEARDYFDMGLTVLPCYPGSKAIVKGFNRDSKLDKADLIKYFASKRFNLCLVTGQNTDDLNLVVLDFDSFAIYRNCQVQKTKMVESRRGYHLYFWTKEQPEKGLLSKSAEIKANGGKIMLPPSIVNGWQYQVFVDKPIAIVDRIEDVLPDTYSPDKKRGTVNITINNYSSSFTRQGPIGLIKDHLRVTDLFPHFYPGNDRYGLTHCPMPVHSNGDVHPSLGIDLQTNRVKCFRPDCPLAGSKGSDVIDIYQAITGLSLKQAIIEILRELGL